MNSSRPRLWTTALALTLLTMSGIRGANAGWPHPADQNLPVATGTGFQVPLDVQPDGEGGMWIGWREDEVGQEGVRLQRVNARGDFLFPTEGVLVSANTNVSSDLDIQLDDSGGVFVAWSQPYGRGTEARIQRIASNGTRLWDPAGVLVARGPDVAVAVGNGGKISHSVDGGETWTSANSNTTRSLLGVSVVPGMIMAGGDIGTFVRGQNLGANWNVLSSGGVPDINALDLLSSSFGIAVGDQGRAWSWDGYSWTLEPAGPTTDLLGVSMPVYDLATAVGRNGRVARTTDGGTTWTEQSSGVGGHLHDVSFVTEDTGWAVGVGGVIVNTTDGGATWNVQNSGTVQTLLAVDFFDEMSGVATGYAGVAQYTNDGGATWNTGSTPSSLWNMGVDMSDAQTAIAVGQDGIIIKSEDGGATWSLKQAPSAVSDFWEVSAPRNPTFQGSPKLASDGAGGVMMLWSDRAFEGSQLFAQRIDGAGTLTWPAPLPLSTSPAEFLESWIVERDGGGAIAAWVNYEGAADEIYGQAIDLDGTLLQPQPSIVSDHPSSKRNIDLVADGLDGAIVAWVDYRASPHRVYGRRLDNAGVARWTTDGQPLTVDAAGQTELSLASDPAGGAFVIFSDNRDGSVDVFAQRVHAGGDLAWNADVRLSDAPDRQSISFVGPDGFGGCVVGWLDERSPSYNIYAQAVSPSGSTRWQYGGVPVREGVGPKVLYNRSTLFAVGDGAGGGVFVWADYRGLDGSPDIFAQNVDRHGYRGDASADIKSVTDVPDDQGGVATVSWEASYLDAFPHQVVTEYSVWRRNNGSAKSVDLQAKSAAIERARRAGLDDALIASQTSAGWSFVGTTPAAYLPSYGYEAPTYGTGLPPDTSPTDFQVLTHASSPFVSWISEPYGGNSEDNHAPAGPQTLAAAEAGGSVDLMWRDGNGYVADIDHYRVYRGSAPGFVADASSLLDMATMMSYVDLAPNGSALFYRVTAVDVHGNESEPSNEASVGIVTGIGSDSATVVSLRMNQPFPNPSAGSARVRFSLPGSGPVQIDLFDLAGRRVYRDDLGTLPAGWHERGVLGRDSNGARLASGMYLLRLTHGGQVRTAKFAVAR